MDRSSYLDPTAIKNQGNSAISQLEQDNEALNIVRTKIDNFANDREIKSSAFDSLKRQLADYITVTQAMVTANLADICDHQSLNSLVGDEVLDGDSIISQKESALESSANYQATADEFERTARRESNVLLDWYYLWKAGYYRNLAAGSRSLYEKWLEKEEKYDDIENSTAGLFASGESMRTAIKNAISSIEGAFQNGMYVPDMSAQWREEIESCRKSTIGGILKNIEGNIPALTKNDLLLLFQIIWDNPEIEVSPNILEYLDQNSEEILANYADEVKSGVVEKLLMAASTAVSRGSKLIGEYMIRAGGIAGPGGTNSFVMLSSNTALNGSKLLGQGAKWSQALKVGSKLLGPITSVVAVGIGTWADVKEGKTIGEGLAHNGAVVGAGFITGLVLSSNPVGWGILASAAGAVAVSTLVDWAYDSNFLGIGDMLDSAGAWIDDKINGIGEALSDFGNAINPFNWEW